MMTISIAKYPVIKKASGALCGVLLIFLCSCSSQSGGMQRFGNKVLSTIGYHPDTTSVEPKTGIINNASDLTREEEYYLGRSVSATILATFSPYDNPPFTDYVNRVGMAVASYSDMPETYGGYHFAVLDSDDVNAMSAPGGNVFVTRGLVLQMPDEDSLAAVLAHEIAHVEKRHGVLAISKEHASKSLDSVGKTAALLSCDAVFAAGVIVFGSAIDDIVNKLLVSGFSRDQEFDADREALKILKRAGYNPHALVGMLEALHKLEGSRHGGWYSTHPKPEDRIIQANAVIEEFQLPEVTTGKVERDERFRTGKSIT